MNCLLIINTMSGNCKKLNIKTVLHKHTHPQDDVTVKRITSQTQDWSVNGYDKVIVCGGDGTLHHALNQCNNTTVEHLVYVSCGTLNESCQIRQLHRQVGKAGEEYFSYVLAGGSFTDIGYTTDNNKKKKYKILAYLGKVLSSYRVHNFPIIIATDNNRQIRQNSTLLMFLQGKRCFGLNFNKMYDREDNKMYLLLIKSYGKDNLWNRIRLFFPLLRVFFVGVRKPIDNNRIFFAPFTSADLTLPQPVIFCIDGESITLSGDIHVCSKYPTYRLTLDRYI